jgi:hypothetical protein
MLKQATLLLATAALMCAASCQKNDRPMAEAQALRTGGGKVLKTRDDVQAMFPAAKWLETEQGERRFMFCANDLPALANGKMEIHGWVFRRHSDQWETVFTVLLNGVGAVTLSVDQETGLFSAKGRANNKFLDQSVFTFDLRATDGGEWR